MGIWVYALQGHAQKQLLFVLVLYCHGCSNYLWLGVGIENYHFRFVEAVAGAL